MCTLKESTGAWVPEAISLIGRYTEIGLTDCTERHRTRQLKDSEDTLCFVCLLHMLAKTHPHMNTRWENNCVWNGQKQLNCVQKPAEKGEGPAVLFVQIIVQCLQFTVSTYVCAF